MKKIELNICSLGEPTDTKTWSGTPYNLYSELVKMNCLGSAFNSIATINKYEQKLIRLINKYYYKNSVDLGRGFVYRYLYSLKVNQETKNSKSNLTWFFLNLFK